MWIQDDHLGGLDWSLHRHLGPSHQSATHSLPAKCLGWCRVSRVARPYRCEEHFVPPAHLLLAPSLSLVRCQIVLFRCVLSVTSRCGSVVRRAVGIFFLFRLDHWCTESLSCPKLQHQSRTELNGWFLKPFYLPHGCHILLCLCRSDLGGWHHTGGSGLRNVQAEKDSLQAQAEWDGLRPGQQVRSQFALLVSQHWTSHCPMLLSIGPLGATKSGLPRVLTVLQVGRRHRWHGPCGPARETCGSGAQQEPADVPAAPRPPAKDAVRL